jgi:hypothetical protein
MNEFFCDGLEIRLEGDVRIMYMLFSWDEFILGMKPRKLVRGIKVGLVTLRCVWIRGGRNRLRGVSNDNSWFLLR